MRELAEAVCRSGSIDMRYGGIYERAQDGTRAHRKLQKRYGESCEAEAPLSAIISHGSVTYHLSGRADGIIYDSCGCTIDEIKTVRFPPSLVDDAFMRPHLAQAMCYAYMLCESRGLSDAGVQLTYYNYELDDINYIVHRYSCNELRDNIDYLIASYHRLAIFEIERAEVRLPTIKAGRFPYPCVREGQRDFIAEGYRTVKRGGRLFVQAPTGTGKTMSALYPAVKALGGSLADKVFYFTAKGTAQNAAFDASKRLAKNGMPLRYIILTAREKACLIKRGEECCNPRDCPYADGHYDRVTDALITMLRDTDGAFSPQTIEKYAKEFRVCPYELSLDLSEYCDIIICDCNYLFDPRVYLRRYFDLKGVSEKNKPTLTNGGYVFLIDEAHNLLDRARNMYSGTLRKRMFSRLSAALGTQDEALRSALFRIDSIMSRMKKLCRDTLCACDDGSEYGYYVTKTPIEVLSSALRELMPLLESRLKLYSGDKLEPEIRNMFFEVREYLQKLEFYSKRFTTLVEVKRGDILYRILCLDPCDILDARMSCGRASFLFSATLTPTDYFAEMLGGGSRAQILDLPSPYDRSKLCIAVMDKISTRHADREENAMAIAEVISAAASARVGNYMVYLPSYNFLSAIHEAFNMLCPDVRTAVQRRSANEKERCDFLSLFSAESENTLVGFCVLGGVYSEGIDLVGNRLIGSIIVGTGIPQLSLERGILQEYYENTRECGFDYAYVYPGINRVLQAAGRVIRSENDKGIAVLIDDRFAGAQYRKLFPEHWRGLKFVGDTRSLSTLLGRFWSSMEQ